MIRLSESQFALFEKQRQKAAGPSKPCATRQQKKKADLPENIVEGAIVDFLRARNWLVTRQHVGTFVPVGILLRRLEQKGSLAKEDLFRSLVRIGEKGDPDWRAERPAPGGGLYVVYIEVKASGQKPTKEQRERIERLRLTGAMAEYFDDFDFGGPHSFLEWYGRMFGGDK